MSEERDNQLWSTEDLKGCVWNPSEYAWYKRLWWTAFGYRLGHYLFHWLSEKWCGNDCPPLDHRTFYTDNDGCRYVFSFLNDSFEIGIGWPDKWHVIIRREVIHRFIWWYLRQWIFGEWIGLRRWIWYKLLRRNVERHRKAYAGVKP